MFNKKFIRNVLIGLFTITAIYTAINSAILIIYLPDTDKIYNFIRFGLLLYGAVLASLLIFFIIFMLVKHRYWWSVEEYDKQIEYLTKARVQYEDKRDLHLKMYYFYIEKLKNEDNNNKK